MKKQITDALVRSVAVPAEGRIEISDTVRPGLRLRVSLAGCDALLADLDPITRKLRETALYGALASFLDADRPALLVLDIGSDESCTVRVKRQHAALNADFSLTLTKN